MRTDDKLLALLGLDDVIAVSTKDATIVASKDRVQDAKLVVSQLKAAERPEWELHREVYRPWGKYDSVDRGKRYQVKRITVKPQAKLSLQKHYHRAEHWVVVAGQAEIIRGEEKLILGPDESTYIPIGIRHRLANRGEQPLEVIEVQSGSYLGEDDIVRFDDVYGREETPT